VQTYVGPEVTAEERAVLARHFTNVDGPVSVLTGLPEATKAALFARYSRTGKPLMRVFLDEFHDPAASPAESTDAGSAKASELFSRVLSEYGDDSVAQLAGIHTSCEQVSNLLTKVLERGRLMGYLEQSTRYVFYGDRVGGNYRYHRDPELLASSHGDIYVRAMDGLFDAYNEIYRAVRDAFKGRVGPDDAAANRAALAAAKDVVRGLLPAGTVSNVGIFGSPQAYEQLVLRMRSDELPEARAYAEILMAELRKVIPDFLTRLDRPDRGGVWAEYRAELREGLTVAAHELVRGEAEGDLDRGGRGGRVDPSDAAGRLVRLLRWTPEGEEEIIASALFPHTKRSLDEIRRQVKAMEEAEKDRLFDRTVGARRNRRHRPGRGWEACEYEFEITSDYGAFRDLQRHRLLTIDWQRLGPGLGYEIPPEVGELGMDARWGEAVEVAESAYSAIAQDSPAQASYLVTMGHRIRYVMRMNAREAMHLVELRSSPQGHPEYRRVAQAMHDQIRDVAGHGRVASAMRFVNREDVHLGRLEAERRAHEQPGLSPD
jgi:thymidylate synthase ThyX